jgi:hypothetical protein
LTIRQDDIGVRVLAGPWEREEELDKVMDSLQLAIAEIEDILVGAILSVNDATRIVVIGDVVGIPGYNTC